MARPVASAHVPPIFPIEKTGKTTPDSPVQFEDVTARSTIDFVHSLGASPEKYMVETFDSGAAWIDYDNDGFPDLYFVNGAPGAANVLYRNNKDGTFKDVTKQAGVDGADAGKGAYKTGAAVGDYDNNGYLDLCVTAFGPNILYRNNGDGTFTDVTTAGRRSGWTHGVEHQYRVLRFRSRRRSGSLCRQLSRLPAERQPLQWISQGRISHVLSTDAVRWNGGSGTS